MWYVAEWQIPTAWLSDQYTTSRVIEDRFPSLNIAHIESQINQNLSRSYLHHGHDDKNEYKELDRHPNELREWVDPEPDQGFNTLGSIAKCHKTKPMLDDLMFTRYSQGRQVESDKTVLGPKLFFVTGLVIFVTAVARLDCPDLLG